MGSNRHKKLFWGIRHAKIETHFLSLGFSDIACGGWSPGLGVLVTRDWVGKKRERYTLSAIMLGAG